MIFADTGALFALLVVDDARHADAVRAEAWVRLRREQLWTIDPVLTELWLLLRREIRTEGADRVVAGILARGLEREPLQIEDYRRAWELGREWTDQGFSLTDRQAFAAIERTRNLRAWSYDEDFAVIRLGPSRRLTIELLR